MLSSEKDLAQLHAFLKEKKGEPFCFLKECLKYCWQDTVILALGVLILEKETLVESGFQISFIRSSTFTLAGLSAVFYRQLFMKKDSLGLINAAGYKADKQSMAGEAFFAFLNSKLAANGAETIRYNRNSVAGEFRWNSYKVDGATSNALYEYHGITVLVNSEICWR